MEGTAPDLQRYTIEPAGFTKTRGDSPTTGRDHVSGGGSGRGCYCCGNGGLPTGRIINIFPVPADRLSPFSDGRAPGRYMDAGIRAVRREGYYPAFRKIFISC